MTNLREPMATDAATEFRIIGLVSVAHFVSHYFFLVLPPLFEFVRRDYGVSYTELGLALSAFSIVSFLVQTPTGFLVDRVGALPVLVAGLTVSGIAFGLAGLIDSFWVLVAMFALAGLGNTAYHPADYTLLSEHVSDARTGRAFSIHSFAGMLGAAAGPASILFLHGWVGWRGAFMAAGALGLVTAAILALQPDMPARPAPARAGDRKAGPRGLRLLLTPVILLNLAFFFSQGLINVGLQNYSVVAEQALYGTPPAVANTALTAYLVGCAVGVLGSGPFVGRFGGHAVQAVAAVTVIGICATLVGSVDLVAVGLVSAMGLAGFATGWMMPSRDMLVREVTPPGSFGKVFGFLSTGFNLAGVIGPIIFGQVMDHGYPRLVFLLSAVACLIGIATVIGKGSRTS